MIEDGTGSIEIIKWNDAGDSEIEAQKISILLILKILKILYTYIS